MDSLTRWWWVTPLFQAAESDSINLRLIVGCLLTISKVILCQRFSIGFLSCDWASEVSSSLFKRLAHRAPSGPTGAHRGPCLSAPYVFAIFPNFLQWVVLLVKSLKHLGPCPIAPAASLKGINNRAGLFQTSIFRISL